VAVDYLNPLTNIMTTFCLDADITQTTVRGITVTLDRHAGTLTFSTALIGAAGVKNNVKVTYEKTIYPTVPILNCALGDWYGDYGGKNGGGSRIFLAGFKDGANILYYSAADNPSYFPDDAVITVGDPADPVTVFGKQFDILVIFKEHSIYSVSGGTDNGFSVKLVHSGEGCDMPHSIQTVSNVLVFANTYGGIYMLHSTYIKDERAVQRLSEHVNPILLAQPEGALNNACSVSDGRYYILFAGFVAFCLDCWGDVLTGASANIKDKLAFYIWELPVAPSTGFIYGGAVCIASSADNDIYAFDNDAADDGGEWFRAYWHSKAFDFDKPEIFKKASALWLGLLNREAATAGVSCPYENGATPQPIYLNPAQNSDQSERRSLVKAAITGCWASSIMVSVERLPDNTAAFGLDSISLCAETGALISYGGD
jgi:hypothetical protein